MQFILIPLEQNLRRLKFKLIFFQKKQLGKLLKLFLAKPPVFGGRFFTFCNFFWKALILYQMLATVE